MAQVEEASTGSGHDALPEEQREALRKAIRLEWITIGVLAVTVALVGLVAGQSQAMRAAWLEDMLSFLPPIAFLIATRVIRIGPNMRHPYGHHRSIGVAHLVAATALLIMGGFLIFNSVMSLVNVEKPPVGLTVLFGQEIWAGWLMVIVMAASGIPPVILGRMKMKLAEPLHDKVLYADADMNKADWSTALATIIGVLGIGIGLWWMDAVAAIVVAVSIIADGVRNLIAAVEDLTDTRAMTFDEKEHPLIDEIEDITRAMPWVAEADARVRDQGHVFHVEMFVVPKPGQDPTVEQLHDLRETLHDVDWKVHDVAVVPVPEIPVYLTPAAG
ncbi:cation transporter [Corynebacterium halotolerans]|uniref:Cation efflux protein transmembrane domain-containing protein n=1 Tax=Corynebacterium halotolerans YIM 70093 = DSM 44683 TaxID=1121362 RepID=M1NUY1_9CORY|nr:cation transporter [Corynebacterium halotolerans]AGF71315.1 hypothetical protein A605_01505 [Corynebacterium halotolerans YIM 70093 = DSM 44683]